MPYRTAPRLRERPLLDQLYTLCRERAFSVHKALELGHEDKKCRRALERALIFWDGPKLGKLLSRSVGWETTSGARLVQDAPVNKCSMWRFEVRAAPARERETIEEAEKMLGELLQKELKA
jgi:hypothetical protein